MSDLITKIYLATERPYQAVVWDDGMLGFFRKFFAWVDQENLDPEDYCGGGYVMTFVIGDSNTDDGGEYSYLNPGDVIAAAYEVMTLWHDGKEGYQLLSLLGLNYNPGPNHTPDESEAEIIEFLEAHFTAGGHV